MNWNNLNDAEKKNTIIRMLISLTTADGEFSANELNFLLEVGTIYGFHPEDIRALIASSKESNGSLQTPPAEVDRMTLLYYLLFLMKIDGEIHQGEINLIYHYGFKLGFSEPMVAELIDLMAENIDRQIEPEEMIGIIRKYMN